jgi:endonuclease G
VAVPQAAGAPGLKAFGFVLSQKDVVGKFGIEDFAPGRFGRYQQSLSAIETLTGVTFDASLHAVDASAVPPA